MEKVLGQSYQITPGLLDELHELFPNEIPMQTLTPAELARLQGQQDVLRKIESLYKEQIGEDT